ncbi:MAG: type II toxin-antitoxin system RatA family toxin [Nitrososphaerales archaeon]
MPKIERSVEIVSSKDTLWEIISDLENEPKYWYGTKEVRTLSMNGNEIDREIVQNFRGHRILQRAVLKPKYEIKIHYLKGIVKGVKIMSIEQIEQQKQRLEVKWDISFSGVYKLMARTIEKHTTEGTTHALERIKQAAETNPI